MREIKFRAWDRTEMREVTILNWFDELVYMDEKPDGSRVRKRISEVVLMQYTGLKDKNGVEIYEGDIVKMEYGGDIINVTTGFYKGNFILKFPFDIDHDELGYWRNMTGFNDPFKVIGNIYENPGLLEK